MRSMVRHDLGMCSDKQDGDKRNGSNDVTGRSGQVGRKQWGGISDVTYRLGQDREDNGSWCATDECVRNKSEPEMVLAL